jgi:1,4-dihydroxy-2-naphthoyl-CoA hydrolase
VGHPVLSRTPSTEWPSVVEQFGRGGFSDLFGITIVRSTQGHLQTQLVLRDELMLSPGGLLHAGTMLGLADTSAGWGCVMNLPDHASGFTTIEGKANFIATSGTPETLICDAHLLHEGRTTQVWDTEVRRSSDQRVLSLYRCTQALLTAPRIRRAANTD